MADFCKQCSITNFGEDYGDLKGLSNVAHTDEGLFAQALCEGCGFILVNHDGECVARECLENHYAKSKGGS